MDAVKKFGAMLPLNWDYLKNPVNWIIVFLMVAIAGAGVAVITQAAQSDTE